MNYTIGSMKKKIISLIVWVLLFCVLLEAAQQFTFYKDLPQMDSSLSLYNLEKNSIDVIFAGSSHVFAGINPMVLWNEHGIISHNASTSVQPVWATWSIINDQIETQSPELIVLEAYCFAWNCDYSEDVTASHRLYDPMHTSPRKISEILSWKDAPNKQELIFPIIKNHQRLLQNAMTSLDFTYPFSDFQSIMKGYRIEFRASQNEPLPEPTDDEEAIEANCENYLLKIIQSCKEKDIPLLIIMTPGESDTQTQKRYNYIQSLAADNDVDCIDFNEHIAELGIDPAKDYMDNEPNNSHLNVYGAEKLSKWLGNYLASNYELTDHSQDSEYKDEWDRAFYHYENRRDLPQTTDLTEYIQRLGDPDLRSVIVAGYQNAYTLPYEAAEKLTSYGFTRDLSQPETAGFAAVIDEGKAVMQSYSGNLDIKSWYRFPGNYFYITVEDQTREKGKVAISVKLNDHLQAEFNGQLNILVYERETGKLVDKVTFDPADDFKMLPREEGE